MKIFLSAMILVVACSDTTPQDAAEARAGAAKRAEVRSDSIPDLIQARVPAAASGDSAWRYEQRVSADLDADGEEENVVLLSDVRLDSRGRPLWEDGHRWQVYVQEPGGGGEVTRLYARFLPNGKLTAELADPVAGVSPSLVLLEQTPERIAVYEFRYRGPGRVEAWSRLDRALDRSRAFSGSPRP